MSDSEDPVDLHEEGGDDLFGDDDDAQSAEERVLSDEDLGSDRGSDRGTDREDESHRRSYDGDDHDEAEVRDKVIASMSLYRHRVPKPKDGTLQSLRVPPFLKWNPEEYKADSYEPSQEDIEAAKAGKLKPVVRFRRNADTGEMESNALMYRWSDGSVTLSVGDDHYEIQNKPLAPPSDKPYQELQDAHYYAAAAHMSTNTLLVVGHVTDQYTVRPNKNVADDALERLTQKLQAAAHTSASEMIIHTTQDPELQKKQAEQAEKERMKAQRRRENAAARMDGVMVGGRPNNRAGGLSIGDLEGGRRAPGSARKRGMPGAARQKRRRPEYDSDDDLPTGARRQDDYDLEDGFIAPSDEELSEEEDDDEEEELLDDDEDEDERPRSKRQKTAEAEEDPDADAEADLDDVDAPVHPADTHRSRRRNVIEDDDEE